MRVLWQTVRTTLLLLLSAQCLCAVAAQGFSFAGLAWGDSVATSQSKLLKAGHSSLTLKSDESLGNVAQGDFTGKAADLDFKGELIFFGGKLTEVHISWDAKHGSRDCQNIEALLTTRYGKPRPSRPPDYDSEWVSSSGEKLLLACNMRFGEGSILLLYFSPDAMERRRAMEAKRRAEANQQRIKAEAERRRKAAGL